MKSREMTWQVRENWSQQLEHKQVPKCGTEPGVRKGKRALMACHTRCKRFMETTRNSVKVKFGIKVMKLMESLIGRGCHCNWSRIRMSFNIRGRETSYCRIRSCIDHKTSYLKDDFKRSKMYPCLSSLLKSRLALGIKHLYEEQTWAYRIS